MMSGEVLWETNSGPASGELLRHHDNAFDLTVWRYDDASYIVLDRSKLLELGEAIKIALTTRDEEVS